MYFEVNIAINEFVAPVAGGTCAVKLSTVCVSLVVMVGMSNRSKQGADFSR